MPCGKDLDTEQWMIPPNSGNIDLLEGPANDNKYLLILVY